VERHRRGGQHADDLIADLPAVAVGAVHDVPAPPVGEAVDHGELIDEPRGDHEPTVTPHWFGAIDGPVELIAIFGAHGERVHLRT
jgi:hypothetical protein